MNKTMWWIGYAIWLPSFVFAIFGMFITAIPLIFRVTYLMIDVFVFTMMLLALFYYRRY